MFSIFGSKKKIQDDPLPPIPGASSDSEYVMVGGATQPVPSTSMYPQFGQNGSVTYPQHASSHQYRPAPMPAEVHLHYLHGVPFNLSKELSAHSNKEAYAIQIGDLMAFATRKLHLNSVEYDFSVERSVLMEGPGS